MESTYLKSPCQHCGGRIEFPAAALGATITCPHCNASTVLAAPAPVVPSVIPEALAISNDSPAPARSGLLKYALFGLLAIVVLAGLAGLAVVMRQRAVAREAERGQALQESVVVKSSLPASATGKPSVPKRGELALVSHKLEKQPGTSLSYVTGSALNGTDSQIFSVRIEFELLDAAGKPVGRCTDFKDALEKGKTWDFKALVVPKNAMQARLTSLTGEK